MCSNFFTFKFIPVIGLLLVFNILLLFLFPYEILEKSENHKFGLQNDKIRQSKTTGGKDRVLTDNNKREYIYGAESDFRYSPHALFPSGILEKQDRIIRQLNLGNGAPKAKNKTILLLGSFTEHFKTGQRELIDNNCPVTECVITKTRKMGYFQGKSIDAILIRPGTGENLPPKWPHQVWILSLLESPLNTPSLNMYKNLINWTETYRRDSTIVSPYFKYVPNNSVDNQSVNYANGKTKLVAWFVSNCNSRSGRLGYVRELQKFVPVDIYGKCGTLECERHDGSCFKMLDKDYKFYLSFENSLCKDYITEKFQLNGLQNNIVPIVMGASYEDYSLASPPDSFIHVDNFTSIRDLANYILFLNSSDVHYNKYFQWKGHGGFINTKSICRICAMLHEEQLPRVWYDDIYKWWRGEIGSERICKRPKMSDTPK